MITTYESEIVEAIPDSYVMDHIAIDATMESHQERICEYVVCRWGHEAGQSQDAEPRQ